MKSARICNDIRQGRLTHGVGVELADDERGGLRAGRARSLPRRLHARCFPPLFDSFVSLLSSVVPPLVPSVFTSVVPSFIPSVVSSFVPSVVPLAPRILGAALGTRVFGTLLPRRTSLRSERRLRSLRLLIVERYIEALLVRLGEFVWPPERVSVERGSRRRGDAVGARAGGDVEAVDALPERVVLGVADEGDVLWLHVVGRRGRGQLVQAQRLGAPRLRQRALALRRAGAPRAAGRRRRLRRVLVRGYHSVAQVVLRLSAVLGSVLVPVGVVVHLEGLSRPLVEDEALRVPVPLWGRLGRGGLPRPLRRLGLRLLVLVLLVILLMELKIIIETLITGTFQQF